MSNYRSQLLDKLIAEFATITYEGTSNLLFGGVKALYMEYPSVTPVCEILPSRSSEEILGNDSDLRRYSFTAVVFEQLDLETSEDDAKTKIDRLSNIEDKLYDYLAKIPNNLEYDVSGAHVSQILIDGTNYNWDQSEQGVRIYMNLDFTLEVLISVRSL